MKQQIHGSNYNAAHQLQPANTRRIRSLEFWNIHAVELITVLGSDMPSLGVRGFLLSLRAWETCFRAWED